MGRRCYDCAALLLAIRAAAERLDELTPTSGELAEPLGDVARMLRAAHNCIGREQQRS